MLIGLLNTIGLLLEWLLRPGGLSLLAAFLLAGATVWFLGPWVIAVLRRRLPAPSIREDTPTRHRETKAGTPSMGGVLIIGAAAAVSLLAIHPYRSAAELAPMSDVQINAARLRFLCHRDVGLILLAAVALGAMGFVDDRAKMTNALGRGFRAREKLALQGIIGLAICAAAIFWLRRSSAILSLPAVAPLGVVVGALIVVAASNAVNLTDGLDGLAAGCSAATFAALALMTMDRPGVAVTCAAFAGACLAFLRFNRYPAKIFMGDTGSLALGGAMATAALIAEKEWFLLIAGAVFVVEALSVILQVISFQTTGRRIFRMSPIHHHFELAGYSEPGIVRGFWMASALAAIGAVLVHAMWR